MSQVILYAEADCMDEYVESPEYLAAEWKANIMADALAVTPKTLTHMVRTLVLPKYVKKVARLVGHVHSFTSETLQDIWQLRTDRLKSSSEPKRQHMSKYQTADDKAKILIEQTSSCGGTKTIA